MVSLNFPPLILSKCLFVVHSCLAVRCALTSMASSDNKLTACARREGLEVMFHMIRTAAIPANRIRDRGIHHAATSAFSAQRLRRPVRRCWRCEPRDRGSEIDAALG